MITFKGFPVMNPYLEILRPTNCLIAALAVVLGATVVVDLLPLGITLAAAFIAFIVCGAGNIANDYYDLEIDKVNRPERPLPSGRIDPKPAHYYSLALFASGVLLATTINIPTLALAIFNSSLLYAYARDIKRSGGVLKNVTVSYLVASPVLFGGLAVGSGNSTLIFILVICAFLVNTSREIMKDMEDYEGDKGYVKTLPVVIGFNASYVVAAALTILVILISPLPVIMGLMKRVQVFFIVIIITDIVLIYSLIQARSLEKKSITASQKLLKKGMALALLAFFLGTL
jgi:geranylgeranylglycerol-phosphate geranylgeranyltransferase